MLLEAAEQNIFVPFFTQYMLAYSQILNKINVQRELYIPILASVSPLEARKVSCGPLLLKAKGKLIYVEKRNKKINRIQ